MQGRKYEAPASGGNRGGGKSSADANTSEYTTPTDLAQALDAKPTGDRQWIARCPSHDDGRPSLSLRKVEDRWLIHCFAGCETGAVLDAMGLDLADLFDEPATHRPRAPVQDRWDYRGLLQQLDVDAGTIAFTARAASEGVLDEKVWARFNAARKRVERVAALAREGKK